MSAIKDEEALNKNLKNLSIKYKYMYKNSHIHLRNNNNMVIFISYILSKAVYHIPLYCLIIVSPFVSNKLYTASISYIHSEVVYHNPLHYTGCPERYGHISIVYN